MRWTRKLRLTSAAHADGEVVWSWRRDAGVKSAGGIPPATVARKPVHRGERVISRKTIAQGKPGCLRWTCMLVCASLCASCTRDRGCSAHPAFPAPSSGARDECMPRTHCAARMRARIFPAFAGTTTERNAPFPYARRNRAIWIGPPQCVRLFPNRLKKAGRSGRIT